MVRLISVRFRLSNDKVVPRLVRRHSRPWVQGEKRTHYEDREPVIPESENCSLEGFDPTAHGYDLVDAFCQQQPPAKAGQKPVWVVQYIFALRQFVQVSEAFQANREQFLAEFVDLRTNSFWKMQGFKNPFFQEGGVPVQGQYHVSFTLTGRKPRVEGGKPVMRWRCRPDDGARYGDAPLPIWPDFRFSMSGPGKFDFVPVQPEGLPEEEETEE